MKIRLAVEVDLDEYDYTHLPDYLENLAGVFQPQQLKRLWYQVEGHEIMSYFLNDYINHEIPGVDSPPQGIRIL